MLDVVAEDIVQTAQVDISPSVIAEAITAILKCFGKEDLKTRLADMPHDEQLRLCRRRLKESLRGTHDHVSREELTRLAEAMIESALNSDDDVVSAVCEAV